MASSIPALVAESPESQKMIHAGLKRENQGKVRDIFALPDQDLIGLLATDRISAMDFILPARVPFKGPSLTAQTIHILTEVLSSSITHHLVGYGAGIDKFLPASLRNDPALQSRVMIVRRLKPLPIECVARDYNAGSFWDEYAKGERRLWDYDLPDGMVNGDRLPQRMFTPTHKAEQGHDLPISRDEVRTKYGKGPEELTLLIFGQISDYAADRGLLFVDTKFELDDCLTLIDEVATPDSSRIWLKSDYDKVKGTGQIPAGYDKQMVREYCKNAQTRSRDFRLDLRKLYPKNPADVAKVEGMIMPRELVDQTSGRYRRFIQMWTEMELEEFWKKKMGIAA